MLMGTISNLMGKIGRENEAMFSKLSGERNRKKIPKNVRDLVWKKYFGNKMEGRCYVFKEPITIYNFEVGHNKAVAKGGSNAISNLRPICKQCNASISTGTIERFKKKYPLKK